MKYLFFFSKVIFIISLCYAGNVYSKKNTSILDQIEKLEQNTEGRVGIFAINTSNNHIIEYRANETFPTGCTSKIIGVAAVLKKTMSSPALLFQTIKYNEKDLDEWSPITKDYLDNGMSISDLCFASITMSDNTAMNLLLRVIGGVNGMTEFARSIGDDNFRQDSAWPEEAFSGGDGNQKDSSTPKAMVESLRKLVMNNVLDRPQKDLFTSYLINTKTGSKRIRSNIPKNWIVGNKTGTGGAYGSTNDIAVIWPQNHSPIFIAIYYTSNNKDASLREDVLSNATKILINEFKKKDKTLR